QIEEEVEELMNQSEPLFQKLGAFITDVHDNIDTIYTPTFVVQARNDEMINVNSANYIYENVESDDKVMKWYEESGHVITLDKEKEQLHADIYNFLEKLDWSS